MWHALEEFVYSNHPRPAVIFNPWFLRGSTRKLTPTLIFTWWTKCDKQSNLYSPRVRSGNLMCQICHSMWYSLKELVYSNHPIPAVIFNPNRQGSMRILSLSLFDFHMNQVQQVVKIHESEGQIIWSVILSVSGYLSLYSWSNTEFANEVVNQIYLSVNSHASFLTESLLYFALLKYLLDHQSHAPGTLFRSITVFCGTDMVLWNILHIQTKCGEHSVDNRHSHITLLWI